MTRAAIVIAAIALLAPGAVESSTGSDLEKVDWANRDYGPGMHLRDGRFAKVRSPRKSTRGNVKCMHVTREARLVATEYGDLTGDGKPEAVVHIRVTRKTCKTTHRTVAVVFASDRGRVTEIARAELPPRLVGLRVAKNALAVEHRAKGKRCSESWNLRGKALVRVSRRCK